MSGRPRAQAEQNARIDEAASSAQVVGAAAGAGLDETANPAAGQNADASASQNNGQDYDNGEAGVPESQPPDTNTLIQSLSPLYNSSKSIIDVLVPEVIDEVSIKHVATELKDINSNLNREIIPHVDSYVSVRELFSGNPYINIPGQLFELRGPNANDETFKPAEILYEANLANLVQEICARDDSASFNFELISQIERVFPAAFLGSLSKPPTAAEQEAGRSNEVKLVFETGLELRTQYCIALLELHVAEIEDNPTLFDVSSCVSSAFYEDETNLKGWDVKPFIVGSADFPPKRLEKLNERIEQIQTLCGEIQDQPSQAVSLLQQTYPIPNLLVKLVDFIKQRSSSIAEQIGMMGGTETIEDVLLKQAEQAEKGQTLDTQASLNEADTTYSPEKLAELAQTAAISVAKTLEMYNNGNFDLGGQQYPASGINGNNYANNQPYYFGTIDPALQPQQRSFMDAQAGAERVEFDSQGTDSFQTDQRQGNNLKRKRPQAPTAQMGDAQRRKAAAPAAYQEEGEGVYIDPATYPDPSSENAIPQSMEDNLMSVHSWNQANYTENDIQPSQDYKRAAATAKVKVAMSKEGIRPPQKRRPWTDPEVDTLVRLIAEHGISWALIKTMDKDNVLKERDQVALKDKARNMKCSFLMSRSALPANFENVTLSKTQKQNLRNNGILVDMDQD